MNTCSCGILVEAKYKQCPRCEATQVLGVKADATEKDVRSAYHLLVLALAPEKFKDDQKLKEAAENKLKNVETAFYFLTSTSMELNRDERPSYVAQSNALDGISVNTGSALSGAAANNQESALNPNAFSLLPSGEGIKNFAKIWSKYKTPLRIAALVSALFI